MTNEIKIVEFNYFKKAAKKLYSKSEIVELHKFLSEHPEKGDVIAGTGGIRKLRWHLGNKGKRGGSRVIYYFYKPDLTILLLTLYAKNEKEDLNSDDKKYLKNLVEQFIN